MGIINFNNLNELDPNLVNIADQIDKNDSLHENNSETKGDGKLTTTTEINAFYDYLRQSCPDLANMSNEELGNMFENPTPSSFDAIMNPESWLLNKIAGCDSDNADGYFKSYLNPLTSYSKDPRVGTIEKWSDPLMTTLDANIGNGDKKHFAYLNPIHSSSSNKENVAGITTGESYVDPGLCAATSFIKDDKTAKVVRGVFNPISLLGRLWK